MGFRVWGSGFWHLDEAAEGEAGNWRGKSARVGWWGGEREREGEREKEERTEGEGGREGGEVEN